jgi:hypothetical protein
MKPCGTKRQVTSFLKKWYKGMIELVTQHDLVDHGWDGNY